MSQLIQVLLVEDENRIAETVRDGLRPPDFAVEWAATLAEGRRLLARQPFDVLVLDLGLPDGSGLDFAAEARRSGIETPVLMLTGRDTVDERLDGFRHGADDYLCKPFAVTELAARVQALHRRSKTPTRHVLSYAGVELDLVSRRVRRGDLDSTLSARELELMAYLLRHPDQLLTRERVLSQVWGGDTEDVSNVLNVYLNYLRNKLEAGRYPRLIHTVRGVGIIFSETDPESGPA